MSRVEHRRLWSSQSSSRELLCYGHRQKGEATVGAPVTWIYVEAAGSQPCILCDGKILGVVCCIVCAFEAGEK
jgi:hypothetical protein